MGVGIVESFLEVDAVAVADASEVHHKLVVVVWLEDKAPALESLQNMLLRLLHRRLLGRKFALFAALGRMAARASRFLGGLLAEQTGGELGEFLVGEGERLCLPVEVGLLVVCKT